MRELLTRIDPSKLYLAAGPRQLETLAGLLEPRVDSEALSHDSGLLADSVLAYCGTTVLENQEVRRLVIELLPREELSALAEKLTGRSYEKPHDNALIMAKRPWRSSNRLVLELADRLGIERRFLPTSSLMSPSIEFIEPVEALPPLLDYQQSLKELILEALDRGDESFAVQLPTGAGKTRTVLDALVEHFVSRSLFLDGRSLVWLAHTEELCEQAIDTFKDLWRHLGSDTVRVVRLWGNHSAKEWDLDSAFVVAGVSKLSRLADSSDRRFVALIDSTEAVVIDEAHKATAPTYRNTIAKIREGRNPTVIGLTATPGRGLGSIDENRELASLFGRRLLRPDLGPEPVQRLREEGVLAQLDRRCVESRVQLELQSSESEQSDLPARLLRRLAESVPRNKLLLDLIQDEVSEGNPVLVFACTVEHSRVLAAALNIKGCRSAYVDCQMDRGSRRHAVDQFRSGEIDVLINFGVLSTGFDAPRTRTVVIGRPTSSVVLYSQMIGRGLRGPRVGGTERCKLIDIRDNYLNFGDVEDVYEAFSGYWS